MKEFSTVCGVCMCVCVCLEKGDMWTELMWFRLETVEEFVQGRSVGLII